MNTSIANISNSQSVLVGYIFLARHGQSQANKDRVLSGSQYDAPLTTQGEVQRKRLPRITKGILEYFHSHISKVYTSFLQRAYKTAEPIAETFRVPLIKSKQLNEIAWGAATHKTLPELRQQYGENRLDRIFSDFSPSVQPFSGGENMYQLYRRTYAYFTSEILRPSNFNLSGRGKLPTIAVVAHSRVFEALLYGMVKHKLVHNLPYAAEDMGHCILKNGDPLVFKVWWNARRGLTLEATDTCKSIIEQSIEWTKDHNQ